jgi:hypothetical protein
MAFENKKQKTKQNKQSNGDVPVHLLRADERKREHPNG